MCLLIYRTDIDGKHPWHFVVVVVAGGGRARSTVKSANHTMLSAPLTSLFARIPPSIRTGRSSTFTPLRSDTAASTPTRGSESCDPNLSRYRWEPIADPWDGLRAEKMERMDFFTFCRPFVLNIPNRMERLAAQRAKPASIIMMYIAATEYTGKIL